MAEAHIRYFFIGEMEREMRKILLGLLKTILIITFVVIVSFGEWIDFHSGQPMEIPGARGITFWQFIIERWEENKKRRCDA